jgi:DNA (cytosine-5)-methyltransferase 1
VHADGAGAVDECEPVLAGGVMRYVELFAGAGGLSLGLEAAGMECVAHAELEPHARAVLRKHWPDTPLHGDVSAVDWTQYAGRVDLVSGGSPCQDLSVAGKRAGLEGARSGLFFELIRAWDETGALYCLWENVDGARSSNKGADFAAVLSAFVGAAVAVPERWASSGVAAGPTGVAAWRVLDLQHFGPPQRRRRVFVFAARAGGCDPAEILAVSESVCGHPAPRERTGQGTARGAAGGVGGSYALNTSNGVATADEVMGTLDQRAGGSGVGAQTRGVAVQPIPLEEDGKRTGVLAFEPRYYLRDNKTGGAPSDVVKVDASIGRNGDAVPHVLAFHHTQDPISGSVSPSIGRTTDGMGVVAFDTTQITSPANYSNPKAGDPCHPLAAGAHPPAVLCTAGPVTPTLTAEGCDASEDGTGRGTPVVANTICAREAKGWNPARDVGNGAVQIGRPRRLTPLECERLMSWPDHHTAHGVKEDGTTYALSDTARYRLCGNGVGSVVAAWIARRLVWAEANTPFAAPGRTETR